MEQKVPTVNIFYQMGFWLEKIEKHTNDKNNNDYLFTSCGENIYHFPDNKELLEELSQLQVLIHMMNI